MDIKTLQELASWEWPDDADKTILGVLRNRGADEEDRVLAAELAGDVTVINDELAEALLSIVKRSDEPEGLRTQAVLSLGPALEDTYDGFDDPDGLTISPGLFKKIQDSLRKLYKDPSVPKEVRRRTLEASARAPEEWHHDAVTEAYFNGDDDWKLTAVFCMGFIGGFDDQILEALDSRNPDIYYQAILAAGDWGLQEAWPHVVSILTGDQSDKPLLLAAIEAAVCIRPQEAAEILSDLTYSDDEDIVGAAQEAIAMSGVFVDDDFDDDDDETIH
jgi:hypothetical protein